MPNIRAHTLKMIFGRRCFPRCPRAPQGVITLGLIVNYTFLQKDEYKYFVCII
jgi:hypothetical protein